MVEPVRPDFHALNFANMKLEVISEGEKHLWIIVGPPGRIDLLETEHFCVEPLAYLEIADDKRDMVERLVEILCTRKPETKNAYDQKNGFFIFLPCKAIEFLNYRATFVTATTHVSDTYTRSALTRLCCHCPFTVGKLQLR